MLSIMLTTCHTWRCIFSPLGIGFLISLYYRAVAFIVSQQKATRHSLDDVFSENRVLQFMVSFTGLVAAVG